MRELEVLHHNLKKILYAWETAVSENENEGGRAIMTPVASTSIFQQNNFFTTAVRIGLNVDHMSIAQHTSSNSKSSCKILKQEQSIGMID